MRVGSEELVLRPANCPHHALVYASERRSYQDLPLRLSELASMFRSELSGVVEKWPFKIRPGVQDLVDQLP